MNIDSKDLTSLLLKDCGVLSNFNKVRNDGMDHVIMLYIRASAFSCVKNIQQLHKIESKKKKARSLRKVIVKFRERSLMNPDILLQNKQLFL